MSAQNDLTARARARAATTAAYATDPLQALYLETVRRDVERAHRWLNQQVKR